MNESNVRAQRVIVGGLVASFVHFLVIGIFNGIILRQELQTWLSGVTGFLHPPAPAVSMIMWVVMSACFGLIGVWCYAGLRPRYGAGIRTASIVGLSIWLVSKLTMALDLFSLGIMPGRIIVGQSIGGFVAIMVAILVGARLVDGRRTR